MIDQRKLKSITAISLHTRNPTQPSGDSGTHKIRRSIRGGRGGQQDSQLRSERERGCKGGGQRLRTDGGSGRIRRWRAG